MEISTKFSLDDYVYPISKHGSTMFIKCKTCNGTGDVNVSIGGADRTIDCPDCNGYGGKHEYVTDRWVVEKDYFSAIGKVTVEKYRRKNGGNKSKTHYMLDVTGIGSGTMWYETELFSTEEEAQEECDSRNKLESEL